MSDNIYKRIKHLFLKYKKAIYITKNQYKLRLVNINQSKNGKLLATVQVIIKRAKIKLGLQYLVTNKALVKEFHPVDASRIAFLANLERHGIANIAPDSLFSEFKCPVIKQEPNIAIVSQNHVKDNKETEIVIKGGEKQKNIKALELMENHSIIYELGSVTALSIGYAASNDYIEINKFKSREEQKPINREKSGYDYFAFLCILYVTLALSGISIVRRFFPVHIPFLDVIVPFGAGVIFFPLIFTLQDITTEVYGYSRSRQMVWGSIGAILFYVLYTQIAIHLPSGVDKVYHDNPAFNIVFNAIPRQLLALVVSMFMGILINDYLMSRMKVIFAGQYLWARILGSTMIGEIILQVVGGLIGFLGIMSFQQLLPNMVIAYMYKLLWNAATIPLIYLVSNALKNKEGIDVFDYDINYNPFIIVGR